MFFPGSEYFNLRRYSSRVENISLPHSAPPGPPKMGGIFTKHTGGDGTLQAATPRAGKRGGTGGPVLQQRGLHRTEYTGQTLREHLGQEACG